MLVPFSLQATRMTVRILCTSLTQTQEPIGTTTPNQRDTLRSLSVISNLALIGTMTNHASGSHSASGKKMTRVHTSHGHKSSPPKNVGPNIINTPLQPLRNQNSLPSSPLSPRQLLTHLRFLHSNSPKPVLASQPHHSVSNEAASRTCAYKPL